MIKNINNSIKEIEKLGVDPKLTEAIILLSKAKDILSDYINNNGIIKDKYTYFQGYDKKSVLIFKNKLQIGSVEIIKQAEYICYALENFDDLEFVSSPTNIVLYLDGREIGELKTNSLLRDKIVDKMSTVFKTKKPIKNYCDDIGWEYDD